MAFWNRTSGIVVTGNGVFQPGQDPYQQDEYPVQNVMQGAGQYSHIPPLPPGMLQTTSDIALAALMDRLVTEGGGSQVITWRGKRCLLQLSPAPNDDEPEPAPESEADEPLGDKIWLG